jgi:hypothetical protein
MSGGRDGDSVKRDAERWDGFSGWRFEIDPPGLAIRTDATSDKFAADLDKHMGYACRRQIIRYGIDRMAFGHARKV